jgi:hypothetical protein
MARALRFPEAVLRARVTCLAVAVAKEPPLEDIAAGIQDGLTRALGRVPASVQLSTEEMAAGECLLEEEIGTEKFVMGIRATEYPAWRADC